MSHSSGVIVARGAVRTITPIPFVSTTFKAAALDLQPVIFRMFWRFDRVAVGIEEQDVHSGMNHGKLQGVISFGNHKG